MKQSSSLRKEMNGLGNYIFYSQDCTHNQFLRVFLLQPNYMNPPRSLEHLLPVPTKGERIAGLNRGREKRFREEERWVTLCLHATQTREQLKIKSRDESQSSSCAHTRLGWTVVSSPPGRFGGPLGSHYFRLSHSADAFISSCNKPISINYILSYESRLSWRLTTTMTHGVFRLRY